jgi:predicted peptidase
MSYLVSAPAGYENMEALPIVLFLHGEGETWSVETSETVILQRMIDDGSYPCIILAPKSIPGRNWCDWEMATLALGLADEIKIAYNCDADRFYIIGIEMGAYATYDFIGHETDNSKIAAAVTIGGAYMFELIENIKQVPLWIFYGEGDYSSSHSIKMIAELEKAGGNYRSTDYSSAANVLNFISEETEVFAWLFTQKRSKTR